LLYAACVTVILHCSVKPASDITINLILIFYVLLNLYISFNRKQPTEEVENFILYYA